MRRNERILDEGHASEHYGRSSVRTAARRELGITRKPGPAGKKHMSTPLSATSAKLVGHRSEQKH